MLVENLENKVKLAFGISVLTILSSTILCGFVYYRSINLVKEERKQIYVLNGNMPLLASQTEQMVNIDVEAKSHVNLFHNYFFTLPADDDYINYTLEKAMYLVDESGLKQKNALQEKGFYAGIMSQSASFSIMCDSIIFDTENMAFTYYGTQRIERKSSVLRRQLVTGGRLRKVPRTANNPHGLIITDYKTLLNKDVEYKTKSSF